MIHFGNSALLLLWQLSSSGSLSEQCCNHSRRCRFLQCQALCGFDGVNRQTRVWTMRHPLVLTTEQALKYSQFRELNTRGGRAQSMKNQAVWAHHTAVVR